MTRKHPIPSKSRRAGTLAAGLAVLIVSGDVDFVRTTSSSGITFAGEKKCMPMTSSGRCVAVASSSMSSVEVFVARMVSGVFGTKPAQRSPATTPAARRAAAGAGCRPRNAVEAGSKTAIVSEAAVVAVAAAKRGRAPGYGG